MNKRLGYFDCMRGIVMIMVVFCHTNQYSLVNDSFWISNIFSIIMLPGFFFISGWFTQFNLLGGVLNRFKTMIIPSITMFMIYVFLYCGNMDKLLYYASGEYKWGYWFTFALFLMNIIHWCVSWIFKLINKTSDGIFVGVMICISVLIILLKDWDWSHNDALLAQWISLRQIAMYFPFYILGLCCKKWDSLFHRIINNEYVTAVMMIAFIAGLFKQNGGFYFGSIMGVFGVFLLYRLVFFYQDFFSEKTKVGRQLCIIGRNTLPIYLIHYFFFLGLKLPEVGAGIDANSQWVVLIIAISVLTMIIVYASLGVVKILSVSKPLSRIMIGTK